MDLTVSHCFLYASDQDRSLEFYRDVLGFQVTNDVQFEQMRWLSLASPAQPGLEIVLETADAKPGISETDVASLADLLAKGYLNTVIFRTDDCDALFERVSASGAEVTQEPIDQPYGVRDCAFRDPAGNQVRFSQMLTGA
jgi:catechol 2,3-dioxygenase-like lactoylglutathione lyase family enzyme